MSDCRETPAFHIWTLLEQMGAHISYHDPFVAEIKVRLYFHFHSPIPALFASPLSSFYASNQGESRSHSKLNGSRSVSLKEGLLSADVSSSVHQQRASAARISSDDSKRCLALPRQRLYKSRAILGCCRGHQSRLFGLGAASWIRWRDRRHKASTALLLQFCPLLACRIVTASSQQMCSLISQQKLRSGKLWSSGL
jgi:hypothetical protein